MLAVVTSPLHSLTQILANKRRKLVITPVNNSYHLGRLQAAGSKSLTSDFAKLRGSTGYAFGKANRKN
jgi:hypothetical protein